MGYKTKYYCKTVLQLYNLLFSFQKKIVSIIADAVCLGGVLLAGDGIFFL